jgi:ABC-type nickel/cobalt efflux system permease component RcnA
LVVPAVTPHRIRVAFVIAVVLRQGSYWPEPLNCGSVAHLGKTVIVIAIFTGFVAGLVHVFSGPDHLAAVAPLTVAHRERSWLTGLRWGSGHAAGVVAVGILSLLLREILPLELLSSWAERFVGVMLIGIGLWGLRRSYTHRVHTHEHFHDGEHHLHLHVHAQETAHHSGEAGPHRHTHAAFTVGLLHGLAGSSHFWGVLPALAFPSNSLAVLYIASYSVGAIGAMVCFASLVGALARGTSLNGLNAHRLMMTASSVSALLVGIYWLLA